MVLRPRFDLTGLGGSARGEKAEGKKEGAWIGALEVIGSSSCKGSIAGMAATSPPWGVTEGMGARRFDATERVSCDTVRAVIVVAAKGISSGNNSGGGTTGAKTELVGGDGGISSGMGSCFMSSATGVGSMSRSCSTPIFQSLAVRYRLCDDAPSMVTARLWVRLGEGFAVVEAVTASLVEGGRGSRIIVGDGERSLRSRMVSIPPSIISSTNSSIG